MTAVLNHSAPTHPVAFDVCGDLPTGTTVLEASAGCATPPRHGRAPTRCWRCSPVSRTPRSPFAAGG